MKSICFFHPSSDLYGSDKILLNIIAQYEGYEVVVVLRVDGPLVDKLKAIDGVRVLVEPLMPILAKKYLTPQGIFLLLRNVLLFGFTLRKHKLSKYNIIYFNTIATIPILLFFGLRNKRVMHLHEIVDHTKLIYRVLVRYMMHRADRIVCVSKAVSKSLIAIAPNHEGKIMQIYNGVKIPDNHSQQITSIVAIDKIKMALIGRIKPSMKGQNILVDAVAMLEKSERDKSHFYIIGSTVDGQEYMIDELNQYINNKGMIDYISIIPFITDINSVYNSIDVVLVPSICEDSLPTTVLEAMSFSRAVIGTISGGIPEMIINMETGILVDKNNALQLSEAISKLINSNKLITEMGRRAREIFDNKFTEDCFAQNYKIFINQL